MIGFIIAVIYFALVLLAFGTIMAFFSSWRDGCLERDLEQIKTGLGWVYLKIKKFAQRFFNRRTWNHARSYYMYYALAVILILGFLT